MDAIVPIVLAVLFVILIAVLTIFSRRTSAVPEENELRDAAGGGRPARRAVGARNGRRRMRGGPAAPVDAAENDESGEDDVEAEDKTESANGKLGAKKRAKLEAKAQKKVMREAAERDGEERRKKKLLLQEEDDRRREREMSEERRKEETERRDREEKERLEREEYEKMKETFGVEEEGFAENEEGEGTENLLQEFVRHIRDNKVVALEDVAARFGIKTSSVVERIHELRSDGSLTGVMDDRGKFIHVSRSELEDVAKFVRQRGRVGIAELAENSNLLINLNPARSEEVVPAN